MGIGTSGIKSPGSGLAEVIGGLMGRQRAKPRGRIRYAIDLNTVQQCLCSLHEVVSEDN
jgi:hypothetical protein